MFIIANILNVKWSADLQKKKWQNLLPNANSFQNNLINNHFVKRFELESMIQIISKRNAKVEFQSSSQMKNAEEKKKISNNLLICRLSQLFLYSIFLYKSFNFQFVLRLNTFESKVNFYHKFLHYILLEILNRM